MVLGKWSHDVNLFLKENTFQFGLAGTMCELYFKFGLKVANQTLAKTHFSNRKWYTKKIYK